MARYYGIDECGIRVQMARIEALESRARFWDREAGLWQGLGFTVNAAKCRRNTRSARKKLNKRSIHAT